MYYTTENENYRKYGIVILEVYDETLRTTVYHYRKPHITISHVKVINGTKFREIKIIYKFIG